MIGARWRRTLRWLLIGSAVGLLVAALSSLWLLRSDGGRDWLLVRALALLPETATVSWDELDGTLSGPLVIRGLRYRDGDVRFEARSVHLDHALWPLLSQRLDIRRLRIEGAVLTLPRDDEPFAWPRWPDLLPTLDMPLTIAVARLDISDLRIRREQETLLHISTSSGAFTLADGALSLSPLLIDSDRGKLQLRGHYRPRDRFRTALAGQWQWPAVAGAPPARAAFKAAGDLDDFTVAVDGTAPDPLQLRFKLTQGASKPVWTLSAKTARLQSEQLGFSALPILVFDVRAHGEGGRAQLQGSFAVGDQAVRIEPSRLMLEGGVVGLQPLLLATDAGRMAVVGTAKLEGDDPVFDVTVSSKTLRLRPETAGAVAVNASGELRLQGHWAQWTLSGAATLVRAGEQATLTVAGRGDPRKLVFDKLEARMPSGRLQGLGELHWRPTWSLAAQAQLDGFDPGYLLPDYPGQLSGALSLKANQDSDGVWRGEGKVQGLRGQLRQRKISGDALARWDGRNGDGELLLTLGASRIKASGRYGEHIDIKAEALPLELADLVAGASGRLQGRLSVVGPRAAPDWRSDLRGSGLSWRGNRIGQLSAQGALPGRGRGGQMTLDAKGVELAGQHFSSATLALSGSLADVRARGALSGESGQAQFEVDVATADGQWQGQLLTLHLSPKKGPALTLLSPVRYRYQAGVFSLGRACLQASAPGGLLCAQAEGSTGSVEGRGLPLALLKPWLPAMDSEPPMLPFGSADLDGRFTRSKTGLWRGDLQLRSATGGLRLDQTAQREVLAYNDLKIDAQLEADRYTVQLTAGLPGQDTLSGRLAASFSPGSAVTGELNLDVHQLTWLELTSPDLADPKGRLTGHLVLGGKQGALVLSGDARLSDFSAELPALGVALREGVLVLRGDANGQTRLSGSVLSGRGRLAIEGSVDLANPDSPVQLSLRGENITVANTAELAAEFSPDLQLNYIKGLLKLTGRVTVPSARIDLERLDSDASVADDVVVLDPRDPPPRGGLRVDSDVQLILGDSVRLKGFGLDGNLGGALHVRDGPGRVAQATGTLEVSGRYRAYGQALTIKRGRLVYSASAIGNPALDILAEREFDDVTVGVRVRGSAAAPETTITSSPVMEASEALAWLVLGRPLSTASGADSRQISAQALALSAGGNLLAQQIGVRLGLDEAGISESRALGGAVFSVGKKLSPRLFVSYGVSLLGTGQVVTLKYLIARGFDVSIESGSTETAGSLNWRKEK